MSKKSFPNALQVDYSLHWYQIRKVLGQGAFGITYLAHDINLDRQVAVKEYMPGQLCARGTDLTIQPLSDEHRDDFNWGLTRFINEARTLTKFEHPNLVRVFNVFEMNNTAYMVMNYEVGKSLQQILKEKKQLNEKELINILAPLMNGLELMHEKGFIHRDIKPGNIFIREDGSPVLLDFGSARQTRGRDVQTLTNFVSPGYAPIEQYTSKSDRQGPWTDIYGLGATLYKVITGVSPMNAVDRGEMLMNGMTDDYKNLAELAPGRYSDTLLTALDHALAFNAQDRPQTIAEWRSEFDFNENDIQTRPVKGVEDATYRETVKLDTANTEETLKENPPTEQTFEKSANEETTINIAEGKTGEVYTIALSLRGHIHRFLEKHRFKAAGLAVAVIAAASVMFITKTDQLITSPDADAPVSAEKNDAASTPDAGTKAAKAAPAPETTGNQSPAVENTGEAEEQDETAQTGTGSTRDEINRLLTLAERDIRALRLMTPAGNNAYEKFQRVLELDGEHPEAAWGLKRIADKYVQLAYGSMESGKYGRARHYLNNAEQLDPGAPKIEQARNNLQTGVEEQSEDPVGNFIDDVKQWFKNNTGGSRNTDGDPLSDDRVKKTLGGR